MPDKTRRRKNNKRKNKSNNKTNVNKNTNDFNDKQIVRSSDSQDNSIDNHSGNTQSELDIESKNNVSQNTNVNQNYANEQYYRSDLTSHTSHNESNSELTENLSIHNVTDILHIEEVSTNPTVFIEESSNICITNKSILKDVENYRNINENPTLNEANDIQPNNGNTSKLAKIETLCIPNVANAFQIHQDSKDPPGYLVESPDVRKKNKSKLNNEVKSKSVDNDESPTIVEITEEDNIQLELEKSVEIIDQSNIIITDAESDVEWEKMDELNVINKPEDLRAEAFSVTTIPLEIAQCIQTKSLNTEQEKSLRCYLQSLNLATSPSNLNTFEINTEIEQIINKEIKHRLRKKGFAEDMFLQRGNISRGLDVIDEEGSSESSATSRRHSYLSDKKSDNDDLEDEVFEKKSITAFKPNVLHNVKRKLFPQECILVDAKLKEPEVTEARGDWSIKTIEKITGAEVVYLTDSSSSTSSVYDNGDDIENEEASDTSIRIITPTIEVTDTENFLTNTFISKHIGNVEKERSDHPHEDMLIKAAEKSINTGDNQNLQRSAVSSTQHPHEIVVLSTDDIKTNLFVKDVNIVEPQITNCEAEYQTDKENDISENNSNSNSNSNSSKKEIDTYDLEMKVLKCELNDAINNLIKEVASDSELTSDNRKDTFTRQDSSSSVCSSQCTAKYNPNYSSLNDVSNIMHEDSATITIKNNTESIQSTDLTSHVKEVFQCVAGESTQNDHKASCNKNAPLFLRDLCLAKIASFPFGNKILEELAHVSERLQSMSILATQSSDASEFLKENTTVKSNVGKSQSKMPYFPLPDLSNIEKVSLPIKNEEHIPPPVKPRNSSLRKSQEEQHWTAIPTTTDPVYVCLSPSQKMLMEKTKTVIKREDASQLIETHKKFIDRRGYNENLTQNNTDTSPIVPFKSQTGSRLLALIRDPSVTNNISLSSIKNNSFKSLESLPKLNYIDNKEHLEVNNTKSNLIKDTISFKPIPPPRPKKFSSSFYESDESSDITDNSYRSMRSEKKMFHYSTGNLNKDIENDISSIQNMHRYYSNIRDTFKEQDFPRRPSLPKDLCEQQMEYIRRKEKEVEEEIRRLEQEKINYPDKKGPRAPLISEGPQVERRSYDLNTFTVAKKDTLFSDAKTRNEQKGKLSSVFSKSQEELLREKMYSEYVSQMAEREQRRQQKFIKISHTPASTGINNISKSMPTLDALESEVNNRIEKEFISRARERWHKLGIEDPETEDEKESENIYREPKVIEHKIKVIESGEEKDVSKLPSHLQEFVSFTAKTKVQEDGRSGESEPEQESTHVMVFCAVIILVLAVGKYVLRLLQNKEY